VLFRYNEEGLHQLCAIVAVARKLSGILHRMWISESDFRGRLRCQGNAEAETETGAVIQCVNDELSAVSSAASLLKRSQYRDPRAR
jgi:hypothetical protein